MKKFRQMISIFLYNGIADTDGAIKPTHNWIPTYILVRKIVRNIVFKNKFDNDYYEESFIYIKYFAWQILL